MKRLFVFLSLFTILSFSIPKTFSIARADEEVVEKDENEENSENVKEENGGEVAEQPATENTDLSLSQVAKDTIAVIKETLSQPLVVGGVSTTIGALAILIISKALGCIGKKKVNDMSKDIEKTISGIKECAKIKDLDGLYAEISNLKDILNLIVPTIKNIGVKENCVALLGDLQKVANETIKDSGDKVVEVANKSTNEILDILNKE